MVDRSLTGRCEDVVAIELLRERGFDELSERFMEHRSKLRAMLNARLNLQRRGQVDLDRLLQSALDTAHDNLPTYLQDPRLPILHWLRRLTEQQIVASTDGDEGSSPAEVYLQNIAFDLAQSCNQDSQTRADFVEQARHLIANLPDLDRQLLGLRHLEQLTISEAACELGTTVEAAKKRYRNALRQVTQLTRKTGLRS